MKINPPLIMEGEIAEDLAYVIDEAMGAALKKINR